MRAKNCILLTFLCMCFSLAVMYGFFEVGDDEMKICDKWFCLICLALIIVAAIFSVEAIFCSFEAENKTADNIEVSSISINLNNNGNSDERITINNVYIYKENEIPKNVDNILIFENQKLKTKCLKNLCGVKRFYFLDKNAQDNFSEIYKIFSNYRIKKIELRQSYIFLEIEFN